MDTGTHFVIGITLGGLAYLDPAIQQDPVLAQSVFIGTIVGSQAPDFDGIFRVASTRRYIKHHRGISHSLPAILLWPTIISIAISQFYQNVSMSHLWFWTFSAVFLHIFLDLFNAYGTQVFRPITKKWIALNMVHIFDPFLFLLHTIAAGLWVTLEVSPLNVFVPVYLLTFFYLSWRAWSYHTLLSDVRQAYQLKGKITLLPTIHPFVWNMILKTNHEYKIGIVRNKRLTWLDVKKRTKEHPCVYAAMNDKKVQTFLSFTSYAFLEWQKNPFGYEVRWIDLRYRFNDRYPFMAIVLLDNSLHIIDSYIGWVYNQKHMEKKIEALKHSS